MPLPAGGLDAALGMEFYITDTRGTGGRVRVSPEDFVVVEVPLIGMEPRPGPWTWLMIEKRGVDFIKAVTGLARRLGVRPRDIGVGGIKDARAVTIQIVSVKRVGGPVNMDIPGLRVLRAVNKDVPMSPSLVYGNRFSVLIREAVDGELVEATLRQIRERGLPTYYGYQRFGTRRPNTHIVGRHIVLGRYGDAVMEILCTTYPKESERVKEARRRACKGDYAKALEAMPRGRYAERMLLRRLVRDPKNYVNALRALPPLLLRIYVEAYQSYLFNRFLSERIRLGMPLKRAIEGDLVALLDEHGFPTRHVLMVPRGHEDTINREIERGRFVPVLPVPGHSTKLPGGRMGDAVRRILLKEGISPEHFRIRAVPEASTGGSYRPTYTLPEDVKYWTYDDSVRLVFLLRRGNYATTLLREVMKPSDPVDAGY